MIFQHTWHLILKGEKTQTRRIVKPGEVAFDHDHHNGRIQCVTTNTGRVKWEVGKTYAIQPARGKPGIIINQRTEDEHPARIRITEIRREQLHQITEADAKAEGVEPADCYRSEYFNGDEPLESYVAGYRQLWDKINTRKGARWIDSPYVWVLTFEVA